MTGLELTLTRAATSAPQRSELLIPLVRLTDQQPATGEVLTPWCKLVEDSPEPCLVLDATGTVVAASGASSELLGDYGPDQVLGHHLLDVIDLVDFHGGVAGAADADRLPPLIAVAGNALARGLIRVRFPDGATRTLDCVAAPLRDASGQVAGTIAFLAAIWS
jgi:PAS domain-containing protein